MSGSVSGSQTFHSIAPPAIAKREERFVKTKQELEALTKRVQELHDKTRSRMKAENGVIDLAQFHIVLEKEECSCKCVLRILHGFFSQQQNLWTKDAIDILQASADKVDKMIGRMPVNRKVCDAHLSETHKKAKKMQLMSGSSFVSTSMLTSSPYRGFDPFEQPDMPVGRLHEEKRARKKKRTLQERQIEHANSVSLPEPQPIVSSLTSCSKTKASSIFGIILADF